MWWNVMQAFRVFLSDIFSSPFRQNVGHSPHALFPRACGPLWASLTPKETGAGLGRALEASRMGNNTSSSLGKSATVPVNQIQVSDVGDIGETFLL